MICSGNFVFKEIEKRDGGEFVNQQGQKITFDPTYQVKVDENVEGKIQERIFKFKQTNKTLAQKFEDLKTYDSISIDFNVELYKNSVKLVPCEVYYTEEE